MEGKEEKPDIAERVGDAMIGFFQGLRYYGLGALIAAIKGSKGAKVRISETKKTRPLYHMFEKRGIEYMDFVILKAQMAVLLLLLSSLAFVFDLLALRGFALLGALLTVYLVSLIQREVKREFAKDFRAYQEFFYSYISISLLLVVVKGFKPRVNAITPYLHLVVISLVAVAVFSVLFKHRYGRDYTFGMVLKGGSAITVKVNYDICANVKPGVHELRGRKGLKKGSRVKLKVEQSFLNLKGGKITGLARK